MKRSAFVFSLCIAIAVLGSAPSQGLRPGHDADFVIAGANVNAHLYSLVRPDFSLQNNPQDYGPWNRDLEWYESSDGLMFSKKGTFTERGGVPSLARAVDGRLFAVFQWFPLSRKEAFDQVGFKISSDQGLNWTSPELIGLSDLPPQLFRVFDPTLVSLPGGGFRLYFSSERISAQNSRTARKLGGVFSGRL